MRFDKEGKFTVYVKWLSASHHSKMPIKSGIRPQIFVGGIKTSCIISELTGKEMNLDIEYEAELEIIFWDHYKHLFCGISKFDLYNGNMKLGEGYFVNPV